MCKVEASAAALERALNKCESEHGVPMVLIGTRKTCAEREDGSKVVEIWARFSPKNV